MLPYQDINDQQFQWLENDLFNYFQDWKESTEQHPGNFTVNARSRMFISWQTHEGLKLSTYSLIDATKFLLNAGKEFVLTNRFCQDPVKEQFGSQRGMGQRCNNHTVKDFGHNENTLKIQRAIAPIKGDTRGHYKRKQEKHCIKIVEDPLPKRKRAKIYFAL